MKNIYIASLLFLTMLIISRSKVYAAITVDCSNGEPVGNQSAITYCLQNIYSMLSGRSSPNMTPSRSVGGGIAISSMPAVAIGSAQPAFVDISSSLSPKIFYYLKDTMLADFVFKIVVIFGVGYLVTRSLFKR